MLLRSVELSNIKCFASSARVDFTHGRTDDTPHKWVVIYGDNGLGKSTFLRSLGVALAGEPALNTLLPTAEGWVRGSQRYGTIRVAAQKGPDDVSIGFPRTRPIELAWNLIGRRSTTIDKQVHSPHTIVLHEGKAKAERDDAKLLKTQIATDDRERGWMICGYGPHRRLTGNASDIAENVTPDSRASRLVTLFHEKAALSSAERWLREMHHYASVDRGGGDATERLEAIKSMLTHGLLPSGVSLREITPEGVFFETPFNSKTPIADLSDGYRTVLAMALDLLRHVTYCFDLKKVLEHDGDVARVTAEGVVLIDEIDSHLHPKWQRTIGKWLHTRFPNIQFIVATHSPLITTRVSDTDGMVIRLTRRQTKRIDYVEPVADLGRIGLTADQSLTGPNFGLESTRDVMVDDLIADIDRLKKRVRAKSADEADRTKLRQLQLEFEKVAPAGVDHKAAMEWARENERLASLVEQAVEPTPTP